MEAQLEWAVRLKNWIQETGGGGSTVVSGNKVKGIPAGVGSCCKTGGKNIEGEEAQGTVKTSEG